MCPQRAEEGTGSPGAGISGAYEQPWECCNWSLVFSESSKCFQSFNVELSLQFIMCDVYIL